MSITNASEAQVTSVTSASSNSTNAVGKAYNAFFKLQGGVYYMKQNNTVNGFETNSRVYRLVVGETGAAAAGITLASGQKYQIDRMSSSTATDTETDVMTYGIMNISAYRREYIFSNVSDTSDPLSGAEFEIYRYDMTRVSGTAIGSTGSNGSAKTFSSGTSGAFFIEELPFGVYYLKETKPGKDSSNNVSSHDTTKDWFGLGVNNNAPVKSLNIPAATTSAVTVVYGANNTGTGTVTGGGGNTGTVVSDDDDPLVDDEGIPVDEEG